MSITISDDIIRASRLSEAELRLEIAIFLYDQRKISTGKARRLAGVDLLEFQKQLAKRGLCVNYGMSDWQIEIETLRDEINL